MKVYHVKTQEDYDALMLELEKKGYRWADKLNLTEVNRFGTHKSETVIGLNSGAVAYASTTFINRHFPDAQIVEYEGSEKIAWPPCP